MEDIMFGNKMTAAQKSVSKAFQDQGFSKHDSNIYAQNCSQFMFQTGVMWVSGTLTAATVGTAKMIGHGVGFVVGSGIRKAKEARIRSKQAKEEKAQQQEPQQ